MRPSEGASPEKAGILSGHPCMHSRIFQVPGCCQWNVPVRVKQNLHKTMPRKFLKMSNSDYGEEHIHVHRFFFTTFIVPFYTSGSYLKNDQLDIITFK